MTSDMRRSVLTGLFTGALALWLTPGQTQAQCSGGRQQGRSPRRPALLTSFRQSSCCPSRYTMLTSVQPRAAVRTALQPRYAVVTAQPQQSAALRTSQQGAAVQTAPVPQQSALESGRFESLLRDPDEKVKHTDVVIISSGQSARYGTNIETDTPTKEDVAQGKLNMAQALADAGRQQKSKGNEKEAARLLRLAKRRLRLVVNTYSNTEAAKTAKTVLSALSDEG
jgi:hypothetical protein